MAADPSIYNALLQQQPSVIDQAAKFNALDQSRENNDLARQDRALALQQHQMAIDKANKLSGVYSSSTPDNVSTNLMRGGFGQEALAADKGRLDNIKTKADVDKLTADTKAKELETHLKQVDIMSQHWGALAQKPDLSYQDILAVAQHSIDNGIAKPEQVVPMLQEMQNMPPEQLRAKVTQMLQGSISAKEQLEMRRPKPVEVSIGDRKVFIDINPDSPTYKKEVQSLAVGVSPDAQLSANVSRANNADSIKAAQEGVDVQPDANGNLVAIPKKIKPGQPVVATPVVDQTGAPVAKAGKEIPASVNKDIVENNQNLNKAKSALALIQGGKVGEAAGDKNATGIKGFLPQAILNRTDPSGVDTRAAIADLGSMILHDRSGAAVTAAESPRLMPFIPSATDNKETVEKKLKRFIQIYEQENNAMNDIYSKDQGYRPNPVLNKKATDSGGFKYLGKE